MRRRTSLPPDRDLKYHLYEQAVQDPKPHIRLFEQICKELGHPNSRILREDFCGTFALSRAWVRSHPKREALCLDLDPEPLAFGVTEGFKHVPKNARQRLSIERKNVLTRTRPLSDLTVACNFSFFIFKDRKSILRYFRSALSSLKPGGVFILEMAGGPGMIVKEKETRWVKHPRFGRFQYSWDQRSHDALTGLSSCSIHFKLKSGKTLRHAFTYDWRMWSIPEIREALLDAGFSSTAVYWELGDAKGEGTGEYVRSETGDNSYSWIAQVVGVKKRPRKRVARKKSS